MILPKWYDLHTHFRQDGLLAPLVEQHKSMGCAGALAMPNTRPPLTCVFAKDETAAARIKQLLTSDRSPERPGRGFPAALTTGTPNRSYYCRR